MRVGLLDSIARANDINQPRSRDDDEPIRRRLREISATDPRFGYRRAWAVLQRDGFTVNRKRVQRLWRAEGLRVPAQRLKRRRLGTSTVPADRLVATHRNHVWALDFLFDATSDGRPIKALSMCDEYTRECIGDRVARSITADDVADVLDDAAADRGRPENIRCDNGPEFVAGAIRSRLVPLFGHWGSIHRAGQPVAERVPGELQRASARRTLEPRDLRHGAGGASAVSGLAPAVQPSPPAQRARLDDTGCVRRCSARENTGDDAVMHRAHHAYETRASLRAGDAPNDHTVTCNTRLVLGVADTITRHPVRVEGGASTRLGLSKRVDQLTGSGQRSCVASD